MSTFQQLGPALRHLRQIRGKKQLEIAAEAEVTRGMMSSYENGHQEPTLTTLGKILDALETDLAELQWAMTLTGSRLDDGSVVQPKSVDGGGDRPYPLPGSRRASYVAEPRNVYQVDLPELEPAETEVFAHLISAFLSYRRWSAQDGAAEPSGDGER